MTETEVKVQLQALLDYEFPPDQWAAIGRSVAEACAGRLEMSQLEVEIRALLKAMRVELPEDDRQIRQPAAEPQLTTDLARLRALAEMRAEALSLVAVKDAATEHDVTWFRSEVLGGTLLDPAAVEGWVKAQGLIDREQQRPHVFLKGVPLPPGRTPQSTQRGVFEFDPPLAVSEASGLESHTLDYAKSGSAWVNREVTALGGHLDTLRQISERLAKHYRWQEAQATNFVLTGRVPSIAPIRTTLQLKNPAALSRLLMEVDLTVSPETVMEEYRQIRQRVAGRGYRDLTEEQLQLALFLQGRPDNEDWQVRLDAWMVESQRLVDSGAMKRAWTDTLLSNFRRACGTVERRLLEPFSVIPGAAEESSAQKQAPGPAQKDKTADGAPSKNRKPRKKP